MQRRYCINYLFSLIFFFKIVDTNEFKMQRRYCNNNRECVCHQLVILHAKFISDENHENDHDDGDDTDKVNDNNRSY